MKLGVGNWDFLGGGGTKRISHAGTRSLADRGLVAWRGRPNSRLRPPPPNSQIPVPIHTGQVLRAHEQATLRVGTPREPRRTEVPSRMDVERTKEAITQVKMLIAVKDRAIEQLEALADMGDEDALPGWWPLHDDLERILELGDMKLIYGKMDYSPFLAGFARTMLATRGDVSEATEAVLARLRREVEGRAAGTRGRTKVQGRQAPLPRRPGAPAPSQRTSR